MPMAVVKMWRTIFISQIQFFKQLIYLYSKIWFKWKPLYQGHFVKILAKISQQVFEKWYTFKKFMKHHTNGFSITCSSYSYNLSQLYCTFLNFQMYQSKTNSEKHKQQTKTKTRGLEATSFTWTTVLVSILKFLNTGMKLLDSIVKISKKPPVQVS